MLCNEPLSTELCGRSRPGGRRAGRGWRISRPAPDAIEGPFIANTLSNKNSSAGFIRRGEPGNSVFLKQADARATIPWAPIFARENNLLQLPPSVTRQIDCSDLLVMNERSTHYPVFGNTARKYEFLLPTLKWSDR